MEPLGVNGIPVAAGDTCGLEEAIAGARGLRLVYIETPANPTLTMSDIGAAVTETRKHRDSPLVAVDNTFMGPTFQHPLSHAADLVVYSATKYLSGFSDMLAGVIKFNYPTLIEDPEQIRIRDAQCRFPGAIFSFELQGGKRAAFDFLRRLKIARNAVSLGGVESLACHPASTTHSEMPEEDLKRFGIMEELVRVSVGVEDWRDLLHDFRQALDAI